MAVGDFYTPSCKTGEQVSKQLVFDQITAAYPTCYKKSTGTGKYKDCSWAVMEVIVDLADL